MISAIDMSMGREVGHQPPRCGASHWTKYTYISYLTRLPKNEKDDLGEVKNHSATVPAAARFNTGQCPSRSHRRRNGAVIPIPTRSYPM